MRNLYIVIVGVVVGAPLGILALATGWAFIKGYNLGKTKGGFNVYHVSAKGEAIGEPVKVKDAHGVVDEIARAMRVAASGRDGIKH